MYEAPKFRDVTVSVINKWLEENNLK